MFCCAVIIHLSSRRAQPYHARFLPECMLSEREGAQPVVAGERVRHVSISQRSLDVAMSRLTHGWKHRVSLQPGFAFCGALVSIGMLAQLMLMCLLAQQRPSPRYARASHDLSIAIFIAICSRGSARFLSRCSATDVRLCSVFCCLLFSADTAVVTQRGLKNQRHIRGGGCRMRAEGDLYK